MKRPWLWPSEHAAKAEVYREFADTFARMRPMFSKPKDIRRAESRRHYMSLALCDPLVRDGLADALEAAEAEWTRLSSDPPRDWKIVRDGSATPLTAGRLPALLRLNGRSGVGRGRSGRPAVSGVAGRPT